MTFSGRENGENGKALSIIASFTRSLQHIYNLTSLLPSSSTLLSYVRSPTVFWNLACPDNSTLSLHARQPRSAYPVSRIDELNELSDPIAHFSISRNTVNKKAQYLSNYAAKYHMREDLSRGNGQKETPIARRQVAASRNHSLTW